MCTGIPVRTLKLHRRPIPNLGGSQVNGQQQFHIEIGVCIVLVDLLRSIAKLSDIEAIR